jgi:hypothetical protein
MQLSDIQASPEALQDYYAQLCAQHVTPAWIGGGISIAASRRRIEIAAVERRAVPSSTAAVVSSLR